MSDKESKYHFVSKGFPKHTMEIKHYGQVFTKFNSLQKHLKRSDMRHHHDSILKNVKSCLNTYNLMEIPQRLCRVILSVATSDRHRQWNDWIHFQLLWKFHLAYNLMMKIIQKTCFTISFYQISSSPKWCDGFYFY